MSSKKNSCCDCCDDLKEHPKWLLPFYPRLTLHKMEADSKKPEWYERKPFQKVLCWVSDDFKIPTEKDSNGTRLIIEYDKNRKYPFKTADDSFWRYATPLTTEEKLKYSHEEH